MELNSLFDFSKSRKALGDLEKLLQCEDCKSLYKNPQRDVYSGSVKCSCQQAGKGRLVPDCFLNNLVDSVQMIKEVITDNSTQITNEESKGGEVCTHQNGKKAVSNNVKQSTVNEQDEYFKAPIEKANTKKRAGEKSALSSTKQEKKVAIENNVSPVRKKQKEQASSTSSQESKVVQPTQQMKEFMKRNTKGETKLHTACVKGNKAKVEELLAAGASPCTKDYAGWTPLHEAVSKGHNDIVRMLLEAGALVNVPGCYNNTPLHDAALNNNLQAARLLINHGANPEIRNIQGFTPRTMAETEEMKSILNEYLPENTVAKKEHQYLSQNIILYGFGLNHKLQAQLTMMTRQFKLKQVNSFSLEVTHMVVGTADGRIQASVELLRAILRGMWILRADWVEKSLGTKQIADCSEYEVNGTLRYPDSNAPKKGRENAEKLQPSLFSGCYFYLCGSNKFRMNDWVISKTELSALITAGDGVLLTRGPDPEAIPEEQCTVPYHATPSGALSKCSHYIVYQPGPSEPAIKYNMRHVKSLPISWLMKCIESFSFLESF